MLIHFLRIFCIFYFWKKIIHTQWPQNLYIIFSQVGIKNVYADFKSVEIIEK